jgi:predicted ATPase/CYTH domain-containing protein
MDSAESTSDDETCSLPSSSSSSGRVGGAKEEIAKAEGVMRSNSSFVELSQPLTKRMRDDTLDHSRVLSESKHPITRVCLTGGPCAGKTTALATLSTVLQQLGFRVLLVPEAATLLMKGGAMIETRKLSFADAVRFQINVMKMQMSLEDIFIEIALEQDQPTIILCDRGVMDGSAYTSENIWQALLDETGWSTIQLRDRRYEAVIHLVTSADGA